MSTTSVDSLHSNEQNRNSVTAVTSSSKDSHQPDVELHFFDASESHSDEESLQVAVARSGALVGENVLDSPESKEKPKLTSLPGDDGVTVGLMAQGLAWVQEKRERRQRLYLQNLAEQQAAKIRQAREQQQEQQAQNLKDNPTFQTLAAESSSAPEEETPKEKQLAAFVSQSGDGYTVEFVVSDSEEQEDASFIPPVRVEEEREMHLNPCILKQPQMQKIASHVLPRGIAYAKWKRLYSLARDGDSFDAFLRYVQGTRPTLLVVRTSRNEVLGGFADAAWEPPTVGGTCYYGGPNACLFKVDSATGKLHYYKWTGANRYIQLCDVHRRMLAFGGGGDDGAFGLCVEQDFQRGSTGPCATFENEPLCSQENFTIVDMEIFGFLVGQF